MGVYEKGVQVQGKGKEKGRGCRGFKGIYRKGCKSNERGAGKERGTRKRVSKVSPPERDSSKGILM